MTTTKELEAKLAELARKYASLGDSHDRLTEILGKHGQELTNLQRQGAHQDSRIAGHDNKLHELTLTVEAWETARKLAATEQRRRQVETEQPPPRLRELIEDTNEKVTLIVQATEDAAAELVAARKANCGLGNEIVHLEAQETFLTHQHRDAVNLLRKREDELRAMETERNEHLGAARSFKAQLADTARSFTAQLVVVAGERKAMQAQLDELAERHADLERRYEKMRDGLGTLGPSAEAMSDRRSVLLALRDEIISWRAVERVVETDASYYEGNRLAGEGVLTAPALDVELENGVRWRLRATRRTG